MDQCIKRDFITLPTTDTPLVSIIIPHYNGIELLKECLDSILHSTYKNIEIIVVDNASTDASVNFLQDNYSTVQCVQNQFNNGFAGGCNAGAESAHGKYLLILNNDTIQENNWVEPLVQLMESNSEISAVQPKIKNYHNRKYFDYAGGSGGFMDFLCFPFARGRIFDTVEKDTGQYDNISEIFWASGTSFITRKTIWDEISGFDETFFAHMEEIDYHWKCQLMGYKIMVAPESVVYHKGGQTLNYDSPKKTYFNHRNSMLMLMTNYSIPMAAYLFFPRLFLEFLAVIFELSKGRISHALAIIKGMVWIFFHPLYIGKKFQLTKKLRKIKDAEMKTTILLNSIIWSYYFRGEKTFSQLELNN